MGSVRLAGVGGGSVAAVQGCLVGVADLASHG